MKKYGMFLAALGAVGVLSLCSPVTAFAGSWLQDRNGWRYQNDDGSYPADTWQYIGQDWYRFEEQGYMLAAGFYRIDGVPYYFDDQGALVRQSFVLDGQRYEVDTNGAILDISAAGSDSFDSSSSIRLNESESSGIFLTGDTETSEVDQVVKLLNQERSRNGQGSVKLDDRLCEAAGIRAKEIVTEFSHTRPDGASCFRVMTDAGITYTSCGENIAMGQKSAQQVMKEWMDSPGHKNNILRSSFNRIGVACYIDNGTKYWVQLFTGN